MSIAARPGDLDQVALFRTFPRLVDRVPWVSLGRFPTPVEPLRGADRVYLKREDLSSRRYGGNKVRTLEAHFGRAVAAGAGVIWATGAYGSNHAVATALHARARRIPAGAALFPQPPTRAAQENLSAMLSTRARLVWVPHAALLPAAMIAIERRGAGREERPYVMTPGGATPVGALAHVSAGLELAEQVEEGELPPPARLVIAVGSTCTTAGLLVGIHLAARLGVGFGPGRAPVPVVHAVRVTPWPITSPVRIAHLARRTSALLSELVGPRADFPYRRLRASLRVDRRFFGGGYGRPTESGRLASAEMRAAGGPPLDAVYSAKSGAALFDLVGGGARDPIVFWSTKSSAPLPEASAAELAGAPYPMRAWLRKPPR